MRKSGVKYVNDSHQNDHPTGGIALGEILYVIFRHKWKIALISGAGIVATAVLPLVRPIPYQSEAKLYIKYVQETKSPGQLAANDSGIKTIDVGESAINTELEILTSLDLAQQVADIIGPEKILAKAGGGTNRLEAAGLIKKNLLAELPKRGNVIRIVFQHPNREIVQPVLNQIVQTYKQNHTEIHGDIGALDDFLKKETDQLLTRLKKTEDELRNAKAKVGVISFGDATKVYTEQISKIRQAIMDAQAEQAQRQAKIKEIDRLLHTDPMATTNPMTGSNEVAVPSEKVTEYRSICAILRNLEKQAQEYELQGYLPDGTLVKGVKELIAGKAKVKKQLEVENPGLLVLGVSEPKATGADRPADPRIDLIDEMSKVRALVSTITILTTQLDQIKKEANDLNDAEGPITDLQTKKKMETDQYIIVSANLERSRIEALLAGKLWNIGVIQAPSPPFPVASKLYKMMAMVLFGSVAAAVALAFLIDHYLDRSLKRPIEVESKLGLPLFISIPRMSLNGKTHVLNAGRKIPLLPQSAGATKDSNDQQDEDFDDSSGQAGRMPHNVELAPWDPKHRLWPFYEGLRDRLITYFEVKNVTRVPKLVAVTSCAAGSGVSTIAAGLAASLSNTGEGKVLLVDMNLQNGAAHLFYKGDLACGLDDALEMDKRDSALVQDHLYVVTEATNNDKLPRVLPKRFSHLVPKLHASDYDYIIFDMPQVSQVSVTPRLARFMDMVLLVVESEKTDRDVVKRASSMLSESKANVSVILNKEQAYVPKWLQQGH